MKCLYLASVYPCLSETFVAREIKYLSELGWYIQIFRIRGKEHRARKDASIPAHRLSPIMFNPVYWIRGSIWALKHRKVEFAEIVGQASQADAKFFVKIKIIALLLTSLGIAEYIETAGFSFDHIRAHFLHNEALSAYWVSMLLRVPYSITVHTRMIYYPLSLVKKIVENASFCVGISEEAVNLLGQLRDNAQAIYLIRNGVEIERLQAKKRIPSSVPLILAVGRLIPKKGFDTLIEACAILKQKGIKFACRIIGQGAKYNYLAQLIIKNDLGQQVQLLGALPFEDVIRQYREATLLVMPSRICRDDVDGLPTVIIEALAMRVPIIATPIGGIPDLIKDKETGLIVPPNDEKALAKAIGDMFFDKKKQDALASQGQNEVCEKYDVTKTIRQLNAIMVLNLTGCN